MAEMIADEVHEMNERRREEEAGKVAENGGVKNGDNGVNEEKDDEEKDDEEKDVAATDEEMAMINMLS